MARTSSTAKKTTSSPAKKTTAAKKTTSPARAPRKTTPAKPATPKPRLSLVKTEPTPTQLPHRTRDWMTDTQGFATLAARIAGIPTDNIRDWQDHRDGTATRALADGSHLHYTLDTRTLTWQAVCRMGAIHQYILGSPSTAAAARVHADRCTTPHADLTHVQPLTRKELEALGIHTGPTWARPDLLNETPTEVIAIPLPDRKQRALGDQLTHSGTNTTDTQPMNTAEIAAGLTQRAADTETAKEHPQP